jgi:hypothetical protein
MRFAHCARPGVGGNGSSGPTTDSCGAHWCFIVESGFGWNDGPTGRLNFCSQTFPPVDQVRTGPSANNGIRELWWNGWQ